MNKIFRLILPVFLMILGACTPMLSVFTSEIPVEQISNADAVSSSENIVPVEEPEAVLSPFSLDALAARSYGEGELRIEYAWHNYEDFTRYYITYDSDGLNIHGYVNIPKGTGPFPVVIALHGYIPPSEYETLDYSTRYADSIARNGYVVLHPNLRNFPPSDSPGRTRDYHGGYTIDVLNLLAHVSELAGEEGIFENADLTRLGIWGHSLGGGVAMRVASLLDEVKAAVLYGAVSQRYSNSSAGFPIFDLENSQTAFSVHHGTEDETISVESSRTLCRQLEDMGKTPECFFYEGQPHTFLRQGKADPLFIQRTVEFYDRYLK